MANEPDDAELQRIARLARIRLEDDEVPRLRADLGRVLALVSELEALDLEGVEPMFHARPRCPLRADEVRAGAVAAPIVAAAPKVVDGSVAVPRVFEGER